VRKLLWLLAIPLACSLAFGQGGIIGPKGAIAPNGIVAPGVAGGGPTVVQSGTCVVTTTTCSLTFGSTVGAGHYLLCYAVGTGNSTGVSCTMTGETITRQTGAAGCSNNAGLEADCYVSTNSVGGQTVITANMSTGSGGIVAFAEITSPSGGHAIDTGGNNRSLTTAMSQATNAATTVANDICIGMASNAFASSPGYTALNWTQVLNVFNSSGTIMLESTIPGSTGVQTATATAQTGVTSQPEGVICLKP
jgi:hypothetical protein